MQTITSDYSREVMVTIPDKEPFQANCVTTIINDNGDVRILVEDYEGRRCLCYTDEVVFTQSIQVELKAFLQRTTLSNTAVDEN